MTSRFSVARHFRVAADGADLLAHHHERQNQRRNHWRHHFLSARAHAGEFPLILSDASWYYGYVNATIYVLMNVVISVAVAVPAAYGFSRYRFSGDRILFFGFLAFRMMAPAVLFVPFVQIFSELNLIDTHLAVAIAHCFFNVPLAIWILEGFISAIPREMDESAAD